MDYELNSRRNGKNNEDDGGEEDVEDGGGAIEGQPPPSSEGEGSGDERITSGTYVIALYAMSRRDDWSIPRSRVSTFRSPQRFLLVPVHPCQLRI